MKKKVIRFILFFGVFLSVVTETYAEVRNALVIGNGNYQQVGSLDNPPNDARLMAETLRSLDFEVIEVIDAKQIDMKRAVRDFGARLNDAGRDGVGLFYYAGHGVQVDGANYIIPVDAVIDSEGDVDIESVNANSILSMMEYSNARLSFVVLDACRNNPYSRGFRSATRGLAKMSAPTGSFIAYATSPGEVAADGNGQNSPYTTSLVKHMKEPGVPIEKVFRNVRNEVRSVTSNQQTPWESSSLIGDDYYFKTVVEIESTPSGQEVTVTTTGDNAGNSTVTSATAAANQPVVINTPKDQSIELLFWDSVKNSKNPAVVNAYINKYPDGIFVELAQLKITALASAAKAQEQKVTAAKPAAVAAAPAAAPQPVVAKSAQPAPAISLASVAKNPVRPILNECESHFRANRLTSGSGGNALECYQRVITSEPGHPEAMAGIVKIENKYAQWAAVALDRNDLDKASRNIDKLQAMNEEHQQLAVLSERLALSVAAQQAAAQVQAQPKAQPVAKVAAAAQPKAVKKAKATDLQRCDAYLDAGVLTGSGADNAWGCYGEILKKTPGNGAAKEGRANVELAMYTEFREHIDSKSLRAAGNTMRALSRTNRRSKYMTKMKRLYEELKMESRW